MADTYVYKDRILVNPEILTGKPVIKGTRIPTTVALFLGRGEGKHKVRLKNERS
jgi:uncharacterized protein (DUF433 family)